MRMRRIALWMLAGSLTVATGTRCSTNPVTGERQFTLISEGQEIQMGEQGAQDVERSIGLVDDADLQAYVSRIGKAMAAKSERPQLPWRFGVVDDPTPNAFALPGGFIYVTRGLMNLMNSEAELATVLGHEIGHVTARHSVTQMSRAQLAQLGLGLGSIFVPSLANAANLAGAGLQLLFLKYGRDDEHQADELGFRYALGEGYDVRRMADVFRTLERASAKEGQSPLPTWLSTHPFPAERIERTNQRIAALTQSLDNTRTGRPEFLAQLDGQVYGVNPRHGFFRDATFLHPDMRFRIDFPQGWRHQNLSQAVIAASPQQDAAIQLTLAQGTPESAASRFLSQQGIQGTAPTRENINGLSGVSAEFQAQTDQGVVRGLALYITHGGNTYQIIGFAPAARYATYSGTFRQSLRSFAVLTDPQALAVQPDHIDIVRLSQAMTLSEFNQRYPSKIDIAELALVNQLSGADARIPAGTDMKRVIAG